MSEPLSGYDSEAIGFNSVSQRERAGTTSSTQTTDFSESGVASQTCTSADIGCAASPEELGAEDDILKEYPPPGLNEFLRKVVPGVLEQLDENDKEFLYNSSDSDEEEAISAKLLQEIMVKTDVPTLGAGDQAASVLGVAWSSAGNSLAVSIGQTHHEEWCQHDGLIKIYTVKHSQGNKFVHSLDIAEKNCITVVKYHPSLAALLAYGTTSGEVVMCNLTSSSGFLDEGMQLTSPSGCHGSRRVSCMHWADAALTNHFLLQQIKNKGKRRGASDQILMTSGSDGTINVWQVNANLKIFSNVICYNINGSRKISAPDISCFDFIKTYPLRPCEERIPEHIFVVGTRSGKLYLCDTENCQLIAGSEELDPVCEVFEGHCTCVMDVAFSYQKPGIFASISMDSELRVYDVNQNSPLKVVCIDVPISCLSWLPNNACLVVLGLSGGEGPELLRVCNATSGRPLRVDGLRGSSKSCVTALAVHQSGSCRIAAGDAEGALRVWELPSRRIRLPLEDAEF